MTMRDLYSEETVAQAANDLINISNATIGLFEAILKAVAKDPRSAPSAIIGLDHSIGKLSSVLNQMGYDYFLQAGDALIAQDKAAIANAKGRRRSVAAKKATAPKAKAKAKGKRTAK